MKEFELNWDPRFGLPASEDCTAIAFSATNFFANRWPEKSYRYHEGGAPSRQESTENLGAFSARTLHSAHPDYDSNIAAYDLLRADVKLRFVCLRPAY